MRRIIKNWISIFVYSSIILSFSCTKELETPNSSFTRKINLQCLFSNDKPIVAYITHTINFSEFNLYKDSLPFIKDAKVIIYENDSLIAELVSIDTIIKSRKCIVYTNKDFYPQAGCKYKIEIRKDGYSNVYAESSIPPIIPIDSFSYLNSEGQSIFNLHFTDNPEFDNYYSISLFNSYVIDTIRYLSNIDLTTENPNVDFTYGKSLLLLVTDKYHQGKQIDIDLQTQQNPYIQYVFHLKNLSNELFDYSISFKNSSAENYGLSIPANLYSNTSCGVGIFAGYSFFETDEFFVF